MHWTSDVQRGAWIGPRLTGPGGSVGSTVPSGFTAYLRILHPSTGTRYVPTGNGDLQEETWSWAEVAAHTQTVIHPQVQWIGVAGRQYEPISLPGGGSADPPPLGHLDPRLLAQVMLIARRHTAAADDVTAALWAGWGIDLGSRRFAAFVPEGQDDDPATEPSRRRIDPQLLALLRTGPFLDLPGRRYVLLHTNTVELADPGWPLDAGMDWSLHIAGPMPQLIWPADHAWAIASEIDVDSTLVGGSTALIDELTRHPALETVRVSETTDLTVDADTVNRRT